MNENNQSLNITAAFSLKRLWRFLCSVRLALVLILVIAATALFGMG